MWRGSRLRLGTYPQCYTILCYAEIQMPAGPLPVRGPRVKEGVYRMGSAGVVALRAFLRMAGAPDGLEGLGRPSPRPLPRGRGRYPCSWVPAIHSKRYSPPPFGRGPGGGSPETFESADEPWPWPTTVAARRGRRYRLARRGNRRVRCRGPERPPTAGRRDRRFESLPQPPTEGVRLAAGWLPRR